MKLYEINPFIRFAALVNYKSKDNPVKVTDCRIFYITGGNADIFIENQHYTLQPGSLFYCCSGSEYRIDAPDGFLPICINFDLTQANNTRILPLSPWKRTESMPGVPVFYEHIEDSPLLNSHLYLPEAKYFFHFIEKILSEFSGNALYFREICGSILKELLLELHRVQRTPAPSKIDFIIKYIETNYARDITNKDLAALTGYHEYYLNRLFLAHTGTHMHNYLIKIRLNHASYLILNTDLPLKAIPEKVGFNSYPHFSSYFKQHFGFSPADYRKKLRENI